MLYCMYLFIYCMCVLVDGSVIGGVGRAVVGPYLIPFQDTPIYLVRQRIGLVVWYV